jgi:hypothetical protein
MWGLPPFLDNRLTDGGKVVSLSANRPLSRRKIPGSPEADRAIVRLEGLGQLKIPMTASGIEPATFQLVT